MDSRNVVFEISSDEEGWGETRGGGGGGGGDDDYDWISELLGKADSEAEDSDDVVLVSEVVLNPKTRLKTPIVAEKPVVKDFDDDDCVMLDGDPDKPVVIENNTTGDSDDLLIVGEKGQIACRDYPHARHLCAKLLFTCTPHERHCHQCHCYVCDSLAPCVHWGNGTCNTDHCHATDKDEFWKIQRQNFKQGDKALPPVPKLPNTSLSMEPQQTIQVPPITLSQPNSLAQSQVSRQPTIRACSAKFGIPNMTNQGRTQQSTYVAARNKFHPPLVSQQLLSTRNNINRKDKRHNVGNLGPQVINSHAIFKRAGSPRGAWTTNRSGYNSSNNNPVTQPSRNPSPMAASNDKNPTRWQDFSNGLTSDSIAYQPHSTQKNGSSYWNSVPSQPRVSSHPNTGSVFVNSVPSQPRVSSQPNVDSSFLNLVPSPQASSQPNIGSNFENSVPSHLLGYYQPSIGSTFVNSIPSLQAPSQPNMGSNFENLVSSLPQEYSQPNVGSSFGHPVPSQPQVYSQAIPTSNDSLDCFQQGNEGHNALEPSFPDPDTSWADPIGQSNQLPLADNSQIQSAGLTYNLPLVTEFDPQIPVSTNPGSLDFQFDSWLENQSVSGAVDVSVPSGLYSPEPPPVDPAFFDF